MDTEYGRVPPEARKSEWARAQLLVPRRERGLKPLLSREDADEDEEEQRVVREAEAANARLLASGMDRCPTGRLPGLGTVKSEHILVKQRQAEAQLEAAARRENAEKVFVQWLKRKQEIGMVAGPTLAAREQEMRDQEEAIRAERRRLADERYSEWRKKKDLERREQRKKEREARADTLASILAPAMTSPSSAGPSTSEALVSPSKPGGQTSTSPAAAPAPPPQRTKSPLSHLRNVDMKWARVYLDKPIPRPHAAQHPAGTGAGLSGSASAEDGERALLRRCLQRFSRWLAKPQHRISLEDALRRADTIGNAQLSEEAVSAALRETGFKLDAYESRLFYRHIESKCGNQCERLIARLDARREMRAAGHRAKPSRSPSPTKRRRPRHPSAARRKAAARRVFQALHRDTPGDVATVLECAAERGAEAVANAHDLRAALDIFLADQGLSQMSELLDKDLFLLCGSFMENESAEHPRSVAGLLHYVLEVAQARSRAVVRNRKQEAPASGEDAALQIKVTEDVRVPLRAFYRSMGCDPSRERMRGALQMCHEASAIEGTVLVEIVAAHSEPFLETLKDDGTVLESTFVDYFFQKYEQYQEESMSRESPSMCPCTTRPRTSRARERRIGTKSRRAGTSPSRVRGTSPSRIRVVKPPRHQQEAKEERDRLTRATYMSGEGRYVKERPQPSESYVALQTLHERAKTAAKSLGSVTSAQVAEVLNLEKPPPGVMRTIGGACLLVGVTPTWKHARGLFRHWPNFLAFASSVTTTHIPRFDTSTLERLRSSAEALPPGAPRLATVLHVWVSAMLAYLSAAQDAGGDSQGPQ